jgi:ABC-2 type transport system ATP-binding protein
VIDAKNLTRKFEDVIAVEDLTLHVEEGEVFGFLGPNGAGKTTTVRMLACLISKTSGEATIGGYSISKPDDRKNIRKMIGLLPESPGLYGDLSAYKNLDFYGRLYKVPEARRKERIENLLRLLGLWERREDAAGTFSKGMKQRLAICRALVHDPQVLFLDEPTANLDPEAAKTVRDFILELRKEHRTIFLNTHNLDESERICDRVAVLKTKLVAVGTPEELRDSLWKRKTVVRLQQVNERIVSAVEKLGLGSVSVTGNDVTIQVPDPSRDNPSVVEAIVAAGGKVQLVTESSATLEDVYLQLVRR